MQHKRRIGAEVAREAARVTTPPTLDDRQLDRLADETVELLQTLIRNRCVNDGTPESGGEVRNADVLQQVIEGIGVGVERYDAAPGRTSIVARIPGSDPSAPSLCLMGHTDVVPVNERVGARTRSVARSSTAGTDRRCGGGARSTC
jgi:hypothetical protein